jgi:hypothetical protein
MGTGSSFTGGLRTTYATAAASTSLNLANHSPIFVFTGSTAGRTLTLPTAAAISGTVFEIKNDASVSVTVATTSSQTIYTTSATTTVVLQPGEFIRCVSDGTNWIASDFSGIAAASITGGAALTKTDDTNVTMTLGGAPTTALLTAASMTLGWTGTLSVARGGTGASTLLGAGITTITNTVALTNQGADIAPANLATVAGLYRVSYSLQDTTADITAGAVTLTISYTDGAGATTDTAVQVLTGTGRTKGSIYVQLASGNLTYATTHTGIFGTAKYALYITTERLN